MFIIADSGSTKTEWCMMDEGVQELFHTSGINPVYLSSSEITAILHNELPCRRKHIRKLFFYGAGCAFPENNRCVEDALSAFFEVEEIEVASDLLAAARASCKERPGISCILGTGSNSCYYDGETIVHHVPPLGFILGDEGSGAVMGKKLVANVLKGLYPEDICRLFHVEYPYSYGELLQRIYRQPMPNRFLAGMAEFIHKHMDRPEMKQLVADAFDEFIERNVLQYPEVGQYPIFFTGSTAFYFQDMLKHRLENYGLSCGGVTKAPMRGLIDYHTKRI